MQTCWFLARVLSVIRARAVWFLHRMELRGEDADADGALVVTQNVGDSLYSPVRQWHFSVEID